MLDGVDICMCRMSDDRLTRKVLETRVLKNKERPRTKHIDDVKKEANK